MKNKTFLTFSAFASAPSLSAFSALSIMSLFTIISLSAGNAAEKTGLKPHEKTSTETLEEKITTLKAEIDSVIGSANCSSSKQCRALPMGAKACGGPLRYMPYSTKNTNSKKSLELSAQHQQQSNELNQLTSAISNCMMVMQPTFICRDNRCQK